MTDVKTISEIRHENLLTLIDEMGSADALAEAAGTSPVYLSQVRNKSPDRHHAG